MNIATTLKRMPTAGMQISDIVPQAGEIIMDATSNKVKIGDGKSHLKNLPWVNLSVDSNKEESNLSRTARMFIENNIDLIDNNDYDTLYSRIATPALAQEVTRALLKADLNPKPYLSKIPQSIRHILEPMEVWVEEMSRLYTTSELDTKLHEVTEKFTKKMYKAMGIPAHLMTIKVEDN